MARVSSKQKLFFKLATSPIIFSKLYQDPCRMLLAAALKSRLKERRKVNYAK